MADDGSKSGQLQAAAIALLVLSWLFVLLRSVVRFFLVRSFGLDDGLMVASQVLYTIWGAFLIIGAHWGMGSHMATLTGEEITQAMRFWFYCGAIYCLTTAMVKIAVGFFLLRILVSPVQRNVIWVTLAVSTVYSVFMFFGTIFQCSPVSYFYDRNQTGKCNEGRGGEFTGYIHSAISTVVDLILAGIPYFMLRHSNFGWQKKAAVYFIMSLGSIGAISTIIRLRTLKDLTISDDYLYNIAGLTLWSWIEPGIGIIAGCMGTLRPLFRTIAEKTQVATSSIKNSKSKSRSQSTVIRDVNLDELRCEPGTNSTRIEALHSPHHPGGHRRSLESGQSDAQSFGSQEALQSRIKRSVQVTIVTDAA